MRGAGLPVTITLKAGLVLALGLGCPVSREIRGQENIPAELQKLRSAYVGAVHEVRKPVTMKLISKLGELQEELVEKGEVEEAMSVLEERMRLQSMLDSGLIILSDQTASSRKTEKVAAEQATSSPESKEFYQLEGTTWAWAEPKGEITFGENGEVAFKMHGHFSFRPVFTWKRKANREFLISDFTDQPRTYRFVVYPDGITGTSVGSDSNAAAEVTLLAGRPE